jgi:flagellar basal body-associated protein FliL
MKTFNMPLILILLLTLCLALPSWAADEKEGEAASQPTPGYLGLNSIVINMTKGARHIRFEVQLMVNDKGKLSEVSVHKAALTHELIMLVSDEDGAELKTAKGKEAFRKKALKACNTVLADLTGTEALLRDLFFTTFFIN